MDRLTTMAVASVAVFMMIATAPLFFGETDGADTAVTAVVGQSMTIDTGVVHASEIRGMPAGLAYDPSTGQISGTPTTAGTYSVQIYTTGTAAAWAGQIVVSNPVFQVYFSKPLTESPHVTLTAHTRHNGESADTDYCTYVWTVESSDGTTAVIGNLRTLDYTFDSSGTYKIAVTATGLNGSATCLQTLTVTVPQQNEVVSSSVLSVIGIVIIAILAIVDVLLVRNPYILLACAVAASAVVIGMIV